MIENLCQETLEMIDKNKIIVILRGVPEEKLIPLSEAMYEGGIRLVECTYDAKGMISDEVIAGRIEMLTKHFGPKMAFGAGTVLTKKQVQLTKEAGGRFIISPDTNEEIIRETKRLNLVSIPGAITPSEATAAHRFGADYIKLFPIEFYGPKYVKTLAAPLSHIRFLAVGGVTPQNLEEYAKCGACGFGIASGIADKGCIEREDYATITKLAKEYTEKF